MKLIPVRMDEKPAKKKFQPKKKFQRSREGFAARGEDQVSKLVERVEVLENLVDELLAGKRKRSEYMVEYMRKRRADE